MENKTVYFGKLQLNIFSEWNIHWKKDELKFISSCIDPIKKIDVNVNIVDKLVSPLGECVQDKRSFQVYNGKYEERIYIPTFNGLQIPYTYSNLKDDIVTVNQINDINLWNNPNFLILTMIHLEKLLLDVHALILHSCYMEYQNEAILFSAPSGTGKTTQANLWKKNYHSTIVNGDKCLLQKHDNTFYACGFFLHGSAEECENKMMPIKAIVMVRQSKHDYIEEISDANKISLLYSEITVNDWDFEFINKTLDLLEELIVHIPVFILHCTMEDNAAHVLHEYLYGGK